MTNKQLQLLVEQFIHDRLGDHEQELDYYRSQTSLRKAVDLALTAVNEDGKMYSHQRRIGHKVFARVRPILLGLLDEYQECETFDDLYEVIRHATRNVYRFGPLATYDTALRIGAKLGILPEKVYMHCGSLEGAKNLDLRRRGGYVEFDKLPSPVACLTANQAETFLCQYKDRLSPLI